MPYGRHIGVASTNQHKWILVKGVSACGQRSKRLDGKTFRLVRCKWSVQNIMSHEKLRWSFMPLYQMPFEHLSWTGSSIPALSSYLRCRVSPSSIDFVARLAYHDRISGGARRGPSIF